ncbi:MAG: hypothetical protein EXR71_00135 [Myxococcales bacterium]|nr:hypothetical protein [Myxococcales bacterium]
MILLFAAGAWAQDFGYVAIVQQAREAILAKDFKTAKTLLTAAEAAAPTSSSPLAEADLAKLHFFRGLVEWRSGDKERAALDHWRRVLTISPQFEPDPALLPETEAQDVLYALRGEVRNYDQFPTGLPEDSGDALIFIDGKRMAAEDMLIKGRHLVQVGCADGEFAGSWYDYGAPPADYLVLCTGGELGKKPDPKADKARLEAEKRKALADAKLAERAKADAEKRLLADTKLADRAKADADKKAAADKAAADKALALRSADKAAADKAAADKALALTSADKALALTSADKAAADKAAADKVAADKAAADKALAASSAKVTRPSGPDLPALLLMSAGGGLLVGGAAMNFTVVEPAYTAITEANAAPGSLSRGDATAWEGRFDIGRYSTIAMVGGGVALLGAGVVLQIIDAPVLVLPNGIVVSGRW